jgi:hypothetical protein
VPGVVFASPTAPGEVVNVYDYADDLAVPDTGNVFSDAAAAGYAATCVLGDLAAYPCSWRDVLLRHATVAQGVPFFTPSLDAYRPPAAGTVADRLRAALTDALAADDGGRRPRFVWCFVEIDRHVHHHGYDEHVDACLRAVEQVALDLVDRGAVVVAHSDHGHTPTRHDADVAGVLDDVARRCAGAVGGAGRVRWIHAPHADPAAVAGALDGKLGDVADVRLADDCFAAGGLARRRVGDVVVVARGERFVAPDGYVCDHGSLTAEERYVPVATWGA